MTTSITALQVDGTATLTTVAPSNVGANAIDDTYAVHYSAVARDTAHGEGSVTYYIRVTTDINASLTFNDDYDSYSLAQMNFSKSVDGNGNDVYQNTTAANVDMVLPTNSISVPVGTFKVELPNPNPPAGVSGAPTAAYRTGTQYNDTGLYNITMTLAVDDQGKMTATDTVAQPAGQGSETRIDIAEDYSLAQKLAADLNGTVNSISQDGVESLSVVVTLNDVLNRSSLITSRDAVKNLYHNKDTLTGWTIQVNAQDGDPAAGGDVNNAISKYARSDSTRTNGPIADSTDASGNHLRGPNRTTLFKQGAHIVVSTPHSHSLTFTGIDGDDADTNPDMHTLIGSTNVYGLIRQI